MGPTSATKYRPDIDGLRAIAVLSVLAFHLGSYRASGGFVGVDAFFVISGYLIGQLILNDLDAGTFSISRFYERRIRRIVPALLFVLSSITIAAAVILYPASFAKYAKSLAAASLSFSNIYFWQTSGYFAAPAAAEPLLHTWSLAVEEQYYLAFPLFLVFAARYARKYLRGTITLVAALSFLLSAIGTHTDPIGTFYLPHTRAWELLLGALVAAGAFPNPRDARIRNAIGAAGLALVVGSVLYLTPDTPFPGLAAAPVSVGAAMIIVSGSCGDTVVARLLAWRPAVLCGLISYSIYLWHWPLIVLFREYADVDQLSRMEKVGLAALSIALAALTWRYIERPWRRAQVPRSRVFAASALFTGSLVFVAVAIITFRGFPSRFSPEVSRVSAYIVYDSSESYRIGTCFITSKNRYSDFDRGNCLRLDPNRKNFVLMGDSHAAALWYGLSRVLEGVNVMQATASGCTPTHVRAPHDAERCATLLNFMYQDFLPRNHVDLLVLTARWSDASLPGVAETVDWAKKHGIDVMLIGPIVEYTKPLPKLLARQLERHALPLPSADRTTEAFALDRSMSQWAADNGVKYLSAYDALCKEGRCVELTNDGVPVQFDYGHLTREGSLFVAKQLRESGAFNEWLENAHSSLRTWD